MRLGTTRGQTLNPLQFPSLTATDFAPEMTLLDELKGKLRALKRRRVAPEPPQTIDEENEPGKLESETPTKKAAAPTPPPILKITPPPASPQEFTRVRSPSYRRAIADYLSDI